MSLGLGARAVARTIGSVRVDDGRRTRVVMPVRALAGAEGGGLEGTRARRRVIAAASETATKGSKRDGKARKASEKALKAMKKAMRATGAVSAIGSAEEGVASGATTTAGMEPKPMIAPKVSKHTKAGEGGDQTSGKGGDASMKAAQRRLTRAKFADEASYTRRRKFPVLFYSKEMEPLAQKIAAASENVVELGQIDWRTFPDGFPDLFINDAYDVRDRHVAFLASFHSPEVIFEQLSIIYSLPKMFVASFTLVLPFFPTGTAERVVREGEVATAVTLARILSNIPPSRGGPTSTIIFDIHALQERFYFGDSILPCFESGIPLLLERLNALEDSNNVVIAYPDEGAYKRFHSFFDAAGYECVVCTKVREGAKRIVKLKEGEPIGRHVVIVDDLVQSGSTLIECQKLLHRLGAAKVSAYATHGVFPNASWKRFTSAGVGGQGFSHFWITDSCPTTVEAIAGSQPFEVLSLARAIVDALEV